MAWAQGRTLHTTRTGRAKPNGKVTRASGSVRKTKYAKGPGQDRPLDFDRACHPQVLTHTPLHPGCITKHIGFDVSRFKGLSAWEFYQGVGLVRTTRHLDDWLLVRVRLTGEPLGFADPHAALSYCRAADDKGVGLECYRDV